ncbi:hypothetical protein U6H37_19685, partial [Acinetobacter baumannii]
QTVHSLNKDARMLGVNVLMNTVSKVKDVAFPLAKAGKNGRHFFFNTRGGRIEHLRIHIALQRYFVTHATASIGNIGGPVETKRIAAGLRHRFQPLTTAFGEQSHRHAAAFVL